MQIVLLDARRVTIHLTPDEANALGLTPEGLSPGDGTLWKRLSPLLSEARCRGLSNLYRRVLIEAWPTPDGGCALHLTGVGRKMLPGRLRVLTLDLAPRLFLFPNAKTLVQAVLAVAKVTASPDCNKKTESSLYYDDGFILIVTENSLPPHKIFPLLLEFSEPLSKGRLKAGILKEHGRLVRERDAIENIAEVFSEK